MTEARIKLEALITEREGMVAENQQRQAVGASMAYTEDAFVNLARRIEAIDWDENVCEHGDHAAPPGKRFCSEACEHCEQESTASFSRE